MALLQKSTWPKAKGQLLAGLTLGLLGTLGSAGAHPGHSQDDQQLLTIVTVSTDDDEHSLQRLVESGYTIAGVDLEKGSVDIITDAHHESLALQVHGYKLRSMRTVDTKLAPDSRYKTPANVETLLRRVAAAYPDITQLVSIGKTLEGRDIWALKISDNAAVRESSEPAILFNALHHAREVMTVEVAFDIIDQLTRGYGEDDRITHWVDANEIWIIPQVNPDGSNKVWNNNNMWRKNARNGHGVDINRNYPFAWGSCGGSSGNPYSDSYRGTSPASEPETRAVMDFIAQTQPVFSISYHSYSELVLYPLGCSNQRTVTKEVVESVGRELAARLVRDSGRGTYTAGTSWELLYSVDGGDIDWMYSEHHVIPYVIEVNSASAGFQPPYSLVPQTLQKMRLGWQFLLDKLDQSGVRGMITDASGVVQKTASISVENAAMAEGLTLPVTWKVKTDGSYHIVLNPGSYRIRFSADGRSVVKDVVIGSGRVDLDVEI